MKTAESVSPKHPDKLCDQISDRILDHCLQTDPYTRAAIETMGGHGEIYITGELTTKADTDEMTLYGLVADLVGPNIPAIFNLVVQSPEIAQGVDTGGAGDQGIMVGYATSETKSRIPLELELARSLNSLLYGYYGTDGKTQITLTDDGAIYAVVASFQSAAADDIRTHVLEWLEGKYAAAIPKIYANPAGDWTQGGFDADAGLTGRKLAVDNYGPAIPIGGGAFSGKDATKVDRSAAYFARAVAVTELERIKAEHPNVIDVTVRIAYAIGMAEPLEATAIYREDSHTWTQDISDGYDFTPQGIIEQLDLRKPQYEECAAHGHFGMGRTWDQPIK
jgi:S-adenosylmethionine synthetase